ncbi:MAG: alpha/beta hydrolase fold domain-containing protein [Candidatus Sumerlaeaceae bacterium]
MTNRKYYCPAGAGIARLAIGAMLLLACSGASATEVLRDLVYRKASKQELRLDIFRPENTTAPCPVVLMIHSGGWIQGDKSSQEHFGLALADIGILAIGANYRLAPDFPYPKPVRDCQAALKWVRQHAQDYGGDPQRIGILGESAGAQLASLAGLLDAKSLAGKSGKASVRAVANLLGPTDLPGWWEFEPSQLYLVPFLGGSPATKSKQYRQASPLYQVGPYAPAFLNLYGTADTLVPLSQGTSFDAALVAVGADSMLVLMEGADHYWPPSSDFARQEKEAVLEFFRTRLNN